MYIDGDTIKSRCSKLMIRVLESKQHPDKITTIVIDANDEEEISYISNINSWSVYESPEYWTILSTRLDIGI